MLNPYPLKACPLTPMTQEEMEQQCAVVSEAAEATDYFDDWELEEACKILNAKCL